MQLRYYLETEEERLTDPSQTESMSSAVDNNLSQGKIVEIISSILTAETRTVYVFHLKTTLPLEDFTHVVGLWLQSKLLQL